MLQALIKKGMVLAEDVPAPVVSAGSLLVRVSCSCISAGTETSVVEASGKSLIQRALAQPEKLSKAIDMSRSIGIAATLRKIRGKLEEKSPSGYSVAGTVIGIGHGVEGFAVGDRIAAAGAGIANHAEFVDVPVNLAAKVPVELSLRFASTVALGSIALQSIRRADLRLGEVCVVLGAGALGLLAVQMLTASGVRVVAIDVDEGRLELARGCGAETALNPALDDVVSRTRDVTNGHGADAVIFAAATSDSGPLSQAFAMCKRRGRVVLLGVCGRELKREDMYAKELDFIVSTSYGPGRYDEQYERQGLEYPYAYVRWTENRNMAEYLRLLTCGRVDLSRMITATYPIERVADAFSAFSGAGPRPLMVLLSYGENADGSTEVRLGPGGVTSGRTSSNVYNIALIGAGAFATSVHIPNLLKLKNRLRLHAVVDIVGNAAQKAASLGNASYATTDVSRVLDDPDVQVVMITTRHNTHAELVQKALRKGKHVFVEKPLGTTAEELSGVWCAVDETRGSGQVLTVGYNRRFSPFLQEIGRHAHDRVNPIMAVYRMNAGYVPLDHWIHRDGGRIVGEACHIIDVMTFLTKSAIESISVESLSPRTSARTGSDNKTIVLKYRDGSVCTCHYFALAAKSLSKEYLEVHFDDKSLVLNDYCELTGYGVRTRTPRTKTAQKGHLEELVAFHDGIRNGTWPIEAWDLLQTSEAALACVT